MISYYELFLGMAISAEIAVVIYYLGIMHPNRNWKTLFTKLSCSAGFVIIAELSSLITGNTTEYCKTMLLAFGASFLGDFFLHEKPKLGKEIVNLLLGGLSFAIGHVFFVVSYFRAGKAYYPDEPVINLHEALVIGALMLVVFAIFGLSKIKMGKMIIPVGIYALCLVIMAVKASSLGLRMMLEGAPKGISAFIFLTLGGYLFTASDIALALGFFGDKHVYLKKCLNISLYYAGQLFLALSLLSVDGSARLAGLV